ncbi:nuclear valosin-containing protein-like [Eurosta solidaginis]|uniref:nuclear valosin-containing protein-like n=1 Tax=Eurosta solidaginis TaxID=178769 RepID=UPI003530AC28
MIEMTNIHSNTVNNNSNNCNINKINVGIVYPIISNNNKITIPDHFQVLLPINNRNVHKFKKEVVLRKSRETFQDIGGMEKTSKVLCELLIHIKAPDIYFALGLMPPRGLLLHGPPGSGKTLLAHAIAGQLNLPLIDVAATELIAGVLDESEERIRDVFEQAPIYAPSVLFNDEIDAISSNRSLAQKDMERIVVSQLYFNNMR